MTSRGALAEQLLDRWLEDSVVLAPGAGRDLWLAEGSLLLQGWSEPHRRYHTLEHLAEVLSALDELAAGGAIGTAGEPDTQDTLDDALVARTIAWYHDLAYDPRAAPGSNEHRSATLARDHLNRLGVDRKVVDAVEAGVLMTADHDVTSAGSTMLTRGAGGAMHDADLWILSAPPVRYDRYREQVRQEYGHVTDELFRAGRARILRGFARRERLYLTGHAHRAWTGRARANLAAELEALSDDD